MQKLEADYVIIGTGAVGMAFADILISETDADIILIDRYAKPGGHWNVAYPFVTLHQPSAFYGVSSRELCKGRRDRIGLNKGLSELATGAEISAYFDDIMRHDYLPTGRVQYFPLCDYAKDGVFTHRLTGETFQASARKKYVDATYLKTSVPSTHTPNFNIANGVSFIPLNDLPDIDTPPKGYVIIGGGKTGIDACLWLLENRVNPDYIHWLISRDAWLLDRENTQTTDDFFHSTMEAQAAQFEAIAQSNSIADMFDRLEACGYFLRLDPKVRPEMFHGATISKDELAALRRIKNIVRMGRVTDITESEVILEKGRFATGPGYVHIDCSASAISNLETKPIFKGNLITPQTVRSYQPVFSAAFIAHIEAAYTEEVEQNDLCGVVPLPDKDTDYIRFTAAFMMNQYKWSQNKELRAWLRNNRLDGFSKMVGNITPEDTQKIAVMQRLKDNSMPAMAKLQTYLAGLS